MRGALARAHTQRHIHGNIHANVVPLVATYRLKVPVFWKEKGFRTVLPHNPSINVWFCLPVSSRKTIQVVPVQLSVSGKVIPMISTSGYGWALGLS